MNIIKTFLLINLFIVALATSYNKFQIYKQKAILKLSTVKKENYPNLLDYVKTSCKVCYKKSIYAIHNLMIDYENISDEDKTLIEVLLSLY